MNVSMENVELTKAGLIQWLGLYATVANLRRLFLGSLVLSLFFPSLVILIVGGSGIQVFTIFLLLAYGLAFFELWHRTWIPRIKTSQWLFVALLMIALVLVSRAGAIPAGQFEVPPLIKTLKQLLYLFGGIGVFLIVPYLIRTEKEARFVVSVLLLGGWITLLYSLGETAEFLGWVPWFGSVDLLVRANPSLPQAPTESLFGFLPRLHSLAPEQSFVAVLSILPLCLSLAGIIHDRKSKKNYLLAAGLTCLFLLTFSRLVIISLLVCFLVILLLALQSRHVFPRRLVLTVLGLLGVAVGMTLISSAGRGPDVPLPYGTDSSIYTRAVTQIIALKVWSDNLLGTGWGLFGYYFPMYVKPYLVQNAVELQNAAVSVRDWAPIHNTYLRFGTELGIEGFGILGLALWMIGSKSFRAAKAVVGEPSSLRVGVFAALIAILISGLTVDYIAFGMFWFLLAFAECTADLHFDVTRNKLIPLERATADSTAT